MGLFEDATPSSETQVGRGLGEVGPTNRAANSVSPVLGVALVISGLIAVGIGRYNDYSTVSAIQRHGQRQEATVLRLRKVTAYGQLTGRSCDVFADYKIVPQGWSTPFFNSIRIGSCYEITPAVDYVQRYQVLPIAYDTTNPYVVHLDFGDNTFHEDTGRTLKVELLICVCFAALGIFGVTALSLLRKS